MTSLERSARTAFDWRYFEIQTGGDLGLQRELLDLFVVQIDEVRALIHVSSTSGEGGQAVLAAALHRLKGSARSIGAFALGDEAERAESHTRGPPGLPEQPYPALLASLDAARGEAAGFIAARQASPLANMHENS